MKRRDLEKHLHEHGCHCDRQDGPHDVWINPVNQQIAALPRNREIRRFTAQSICKTLGVPVVKGA